MLKMGDLVEIVELTSAKSCGYSIVLEEEQQGAHDLLVLWHGSLCHIYIDNLRRLEGRPDVLSRC